ncbi:hypothetical protein ABTG49_20175, partial [Acinetobacter baumannii]
EGPGAPGSRPFRRSQTDRQGARDPGRLSPKPLGPSPGGPLAFGGRRAFAGRHQLPKPSLLPVRAPDCPLLPQEGGGIQPVPRPPHPLGGKA